MGLTFRLPDTCTTINPCSDQDYRTVNQADAEGRLLRLHCRTFELCRHHLSALRLCRI